MAKRHVIIGAGKAALSAFDEIRRVSAEDKVKLISMEDCLPYCSAALVYLLSGKITEEALWMKRKDDFKKMRGTLVMGKKITGILPEKAKVIYQDGTSEVYDDLLIASGSETTKPSIEGLEGTEVHELKTLVDCRRLLQELAVKRRVTILGGGMTGMKIAAALLEKGHQVSIVEVEKEILPQHFADDAARYIRDIFIDHGARFFSGRRATGLASRKGKVKVNLSDGSGIESDVVINAAGVSSRVSFLGGTGVKIDGGIITDRRMRTSVDSIYAAGDVAEGPDFFTGKPRKNAIIPNATRQGRVAGANMAGRELEDEGGIPMAAFNFFGNQAFSLGIFNLPGRSLEIYEQKDERKRKFKRFTFDGDRLIGAMFLNEKIDPGIVVHLIRERLNLGSHKACLFEGTQPLSNPWLNSLSSFQHFHY